jgi:hypothetical protein
MKKIVLISGLIAGLVSIGWGVAYIAVCLNSDKPMDMGNGMLYGYASMLLAFSVIFVAIKNYRDKHNGGIISFGKAFRIGLYISLIASTIYVLIWLIDYYYFIPEGSFEQQYTNYTLEALKAEGATQPELDAKAAELAKDWESYKNPFVNAMITYVEILPVGLLVSLIAALVLKRKRPKAEFQTATA